MHADLLKLLLPPVAYDKTGLALSAEIAAEGARLDAFQAAIEGLLVEIDPRTTDLLLPDFERVYGLPDECGCTSTDEDSRRAALIAKIAEIGGLSKPYFLSLATALGETGVTITSFKPTNCEMSCEAPILDETWRFLLLVNIPDRENVRSYFHVGSRCGDRVDTYAKGRLECVLLRLKPANTYMKFSYEAV